MIKLSQTQARAVAYKIRERLREYKKTFRNQLEEDYKNSDDYKNKLREVHDFVVYAYQTRLKINIPLKLSTSRYGLCRLEDEEDTNEAEELIMKAITEDYVSAHDTTKLVPSEDELVTNLIFESLTSEGIEELMNKFIEQYK